VDEIRETFFEECEDLLEQLSDGLGVLRGGVFCEETINSIFRAVHSIKGGAGAFGLDALVSFSHKYENILDELRAHRLELSPKLFDLLQSASDQLANLVEALREDRSWNGDTVSRLEKQLEEALGVSASEVEPDFKPLAIDLEFDDAMTQETVFLITFSPNLDLLRNGHEPLFLFQQLEQLGDLSVRLDPSDLPDLKALDPTKLHLKWQLNLSTRSDEQAVRKVFEFVDGLSDLTIEQDQLAVEETAPAPPPEVLEIAPKPPEAKTSPTLRVDLERVDRIVNTIGELIINQAMLTQALSDLPRDDLREIEGQLEGYRQLARDLQEDVMALRAQPVKPLFQRLSRIVREAAASVGKSVELELVGESTEVDKTLIERLADPLTHMIRNAVDHGLEDPETRIKAGKTEAGTIQMAASHRSGSVFIEISDDGAGLDRTKIRNIAIRKGLIGADVDLSESEIDHLLFLPGFSTASSVSNLSGRGVGLDVVTNAVTALGGRASITSEFGQGTRFTVVVPLTLAVMDGMVIGVGNHKMVLPLACILETLRPRPKDLFYLGTDGPFISVRGALLPVIDVASSFGFDTPDREDRLILILVETQSLGQCALSVSTILDQRQIVVKSLDGIDECSAGVAAATILGNGEIAMILDPDGVVEATLGHETHFKTGDLKHAIAG